MMFRLDGKVAVVTGGSKGIGFGMAQSLGRAGATIVIAGRGKDTLEQAAEQLKSEGVNVGHYSVDVTKKQDVQQWIKEVIRAFGSIDILINNAGTNIRKSLLEVEEEDWDKVMDTNLKGIFLVGQAVAKQMIQQEYGRMINISSIFGGIGGSHQTSYAASKGGINQLTKVWAEEMATKGVTVNAIAPGYIQTPMTEGWLSDKERYDHIVDQTMMKRVGTLEDLNGPVVFLASESSGYITGQTLYVDGGWTAK